MKGLLTKDFMLMKNQKYFFMLIFLIGGIISFVGDDHTYVIGFTTFVGTMFTLSTISYDEFDNGNAFLFTLPITRKKYVLEKYVFGIIIGICMLVASMILSCIISIIHSSIYFEKIVMTSIIIFIAILFLLSFMLPFHLKFGGEKGRLVIILAIGLIFIFAFGMNYIVQILRIDWLGILNSLFVLNIGILLFLLFIIVCLLMLISYMVSMRIMNKKEF